jgi:high affinity Mn2+ porin
MVRSILRGIALMVFVMSLASVAYASETEALMKMLLKKGIITQTEYDEVTGELQKEIQWKEHVDKHIIHAEETVPKIIDGLSIAGGITMIGQGTSGNDKNNPPEDDVIDGSISADLEMSVKTGEHGEAFLSFETGEGAGLDGDEIVSFWGVNADAGVDNNVRLTEAWYEHRFINDKVTFTIGKLDLTNYFDSNEVANDETTQFLSPGFVNSIAIEVPDNSAAVRLTVSPVELLDISLGAQSDGWEDIDEKNFFIGEVDIKPEFAGLQGNYRVYAWTNRGYHTELKDEAKDKEKGSGYGISLDQQVTDFLTLFGRAGYQDKKLYEVDIAWSGGLALSGSLWGRDDDVFGIAYGQARLSGDYKDVLEADGANPADEGHFEAYYSLEVNEHLSVSPDVQVITNASGNDDFKTVTVGAVRGQITF